MDSLQLIYKTSRISYIRLGTGPKLVFCFHGYGEDSHSFSFFEKYGGTQYSFFAIDLPYHGNTQWNEGLNCTADDLLEIMRAILAENKLPTFGDWLFSLIGFSLGGRITLSLYEKVPSQIEKIILLAPDGLKVNIWYWFSTQTLVGNKLFSFTMKYPAWFFVLLKCLNKLRLVNASIFKFVSYYIGDGDVRQLLYKRWTGLRRFRPDLKKIKSAIHDNNTQVRLIYGIHDRIILPARGQKFIKGMDKNARLSVIHSGHQVLHEKHAQEIMPALLH